MSFRAYALLIALSASLSGCINSNSDLETWVAETRARKSTKIDPIPKMAPYVAYGFIAENRRDPYTATPDASAEKRSGGAHPDMARNKEPLEEFPIDALRFVGTVSVHGRLYALIQAPDSVVHRLTVGHHLGQNFGAITGVTQAEIALVEFIPDGFGGYEQRPAILGAAE